MKRFWRWVFNVLMIVSLLVFVGTALLWVRSFRVLDEVYGQMRLHDFDLYWFDGRCQIRVTKEYLLRADAKANVDVTEIDHPFRFLQEVPETQPLIGNYVTRSRWPLGDTEKWEPRATFFPGFYWESRIAWARDGLGRYASLFWVQFPYWAVFIVSAIAPSTWMIRCRRRIQAVQTGLCGVCGYDLRATPDRCPECGTIPAKKEVMG